MSNFDREAHMLGTLYGNCIGDAIGLLTEFMGKRDAEIYYKQYLSKGGLQYDQKVPDMHRSRWKTGDWTDDSDQMILIIDSLLYKQKIDYVDYGNRLLNWARNGFAELGDYGGNGIGSTTHHVLHNKEYQNNPHEAAKYIWEKSGCFVAPNGAVMRTSVLGIYQYDDIEMVKQNTLNICKVTHADPRCQASCIAVTCAIAFMLQQKPEHLKKDKYNIEAIVNDSFKHAKEVFTGPDAKKQCDELEFYMKKAKKLKELKLDEQDKIGYTYKTLGAGFWALKQTDFKKALTDITMEAGDADTNGAVAGALLGCKLGLPGLPKHWLDGLLHKKWLDTRIYKFFSFSFPKMEINHVEPPIDPPNSTDEKTGTMLTGAEGTVKQTEDNGVQKSSEEQNAVGSKEIDVPFIDESDSR